MGTFKVGDKVVRYTIRENHSSKYLILNLREDWVLEISFPREFGLTVKKILEKKRPWIERKYRELSKRRRVVGNRRVLYRGRDYRLNILRGNKQKVQTHGNEITMNVEKGQSVKEALERWLAQKSKRYATRKAEKFAEILGINQGFSVDVKDMKSWGMCVDKKHLLFNWQLIGLPSQLAEYVVAHELVHLVEKSHSKKFERKLVAINPRYKEMREDLKNYVISQ